MYNKHYSVFSAIWKDCVLYECKRDENIVVKRRRCVSVLEHGGRHNRRARWWSGGLTNRERGDSGGLVTHIDAAHHVPCSNVKLRSVRCRWMTNLLGEPSSSPHWGGHSPVDIDCRSKSKNIFRHMLLLYVRTKCYISYFFGNIDRIIIIFQNS